MEKLSPQEVKRLINLNSKPSPYATEGDKITRAKLRSLDIHEGLLVNVAPTPKGASQTNIQIIQVRANSNANQCGIKISSKKISDSELLIERIA